MQMIRVIGFSIGSSRLRFFNLLIDHPIAYGYALLKRVVAANH